MKADKAIRLLKHISPCSVSFSSLAPGATLSTGISFGTNEGWTLLSGLADPTSDSTTAILEWSDTIDIAGLAANDISLINQGGAVARPSSPYSLLDESCAVTQMTIVSVNPIELTANDLGAANGLYVEGNLQDYFLATTQEFMKAADSVYLFTKSGEHNFGTGGIAQATKLYVKSFVWVYVNAESVAVSANVFIPPVTVALASVTAELDPIQMAAAIYRANDQE